MYHLEFQDRKVPWKSLLNSSQIIRLPISQVLKLLGVSFVHIHSQNKGKWDPRGFKASLCWRFTYTRDISAIILLKKSISYLGMFLFRNREPLFSSLSQGEYLYSEDKEDPSSLTITEFSDPFSSVRLDKAPKTSTETPAENEKTKNPETEPITLQRPNLELIANAPLQVYLRRNGTKDIPMRG